VRHPVVGVAGDGARARCRARRRRRCPRA
jgi:formylglycine-generating enzyme required for sulfatase activity